MYWNLVLSASACATDKLNSNIRCIEIDVGRAGAGDGRVE